MRFPIVIFLLISSLLFPIPLAIPTTKSDKTITLDLIHKDSFSSHTQYYDRLTNSLKRSIHRVNRLMNSSSGSSYINHAIMLLPGDGDYLMKISIGTPSVDIYAALETRSDLIWTQCKSCIVCFNQNGPYYDPSNSSTYAPLSCDSSLCYPSVQDAGSTFSSLATACSNGSCFYFQREGSFLTDGILATDHVTLGDIVTLPNATFGCGMFNAYNGVDDVNRNTSVVVSGSVGLGPGPTSIVSTVYEYSLSTSFAYCLSPPFVNNGTSKIGFGVDYEDGCNGTKSTSMWFSAPYSDYRFVLSAISIGDEMVVFSQDNQTVLNMIMDVGTPLTYLPINFYEEVALKVESQTKHLTRVADPLALLGLCYNVSNTSDHALFDIDVPTVTLQLGLDGYHVVTPLKLKAANVFVKTADDVACLAFVPTRSMDTGVYGNLAQTGFLVTYDLGQSMLSFKETNCSDI